MTDKKTEPSQDDRARTQTPVLTTPANKRVPPSETPAGTANATPAASRSVLAPLALVAALIAVGLSGALWLQHRELQDAQALLSAKVTSGERVATQTDAQLRELRERVQSQQGRIESLRAELDEAAVVVRDLDEALRSMTERGSELVLLNDVDHLATIAQQQLQLGGNVRNAIVALESAQAQLARANRPALASLLQTVNGDLDRLRAASTIDIAAFSRQLEELAMLLTDAPLIMPDQSAPAEASAAEQPAREQPAPTVPPQGDADAPWWEKAWETTRQWSRDAWGSVREDLGEFIEVRRVDDASALLMSPDQAARFRENLRTRVMTAQLALMMRQPEVWRAETDAIVKAIETRYDEASPLTRKALRLARGMADASIDAQLPTVDNTLQALNALREEQSRGFGGREAPTNGSQPNGAGRAQEEGAGEAAPGASGAGAAPADASPSDGASSFDGARSADGHALPEGRQADGATANGASAGSQAGGTGNGISPNGAPQAGTPESGAPGSGTPEGGTRNGISPNGALQAGTPESGAPGSGTPESGMPRNGTPQGGSQSGPAPSGDMPGSTPSNGTSPGGATSSGAPAATMPPTGTPGRTNPPSNGRSEG